MQDSGERLEGAAFGKENDPPPWPQCAYASPKRHASREKSSPMTDNFFSFFLALALAFLPINYFLLTFPF